MSRYIDADAVFELFKPFKDALDDEKVKSAYIQTLTLIHNAPSKERTVSDDLIRRSDAINAVLGSLNNDVYKSSWESGAVKEVEQTLERLSSAPSIDIVRWCESCARKNCCYTMEIRPRCYVATTNTASGTPESYLAKSLRFSRDSHEIENTEQTEREGE